MRFEIRLKRQRLQLLWKGAVPDQFPRLEFGRMGRFAGVVIGYSLFQISGGANVLLVGKSGASDDVDVPYGTNPSSLPLRSSFAGHCFALAVSAWLRHAKPVRAKRGGPGRIRTCDNTVMSGGF